MSTSVQNPIPGTTVDLDRLLQRNEFTKALLKNPTERQISVQNIGVTYTEQPKYCTDECKSCVFTLDFTIDEVKNLAQFGERIF